MSLVLQDQLVLSPATAEHLQEEIDTIEAGSDVTDVVGTYARPFSSLFFNPKTK